MSQFYERVATALQASNVPAFLNWWRKSAAHPTTPDIYCVYYRANPKEALAADDEAFMVSTEFCVTVFGHSDITQAVASVTQALEAAGFEVIEVEDDEEVKPGDYATHLYCAAYDQQ